MTARICKMIDSYDLCDFWHTSFLFRTYLSTLFSPAVHNKMAPFRE